MNSYDRIVGRLSSIPLFESIKDNTTALQELARICHTETAGKGKTIIAEGELGSTLYIVDTGGVEIHKRTRAGDDYTVVQLQAENNVFFGELALIDDDKRSATVIATEDSEFIVIEKSRFLSLGDTHPAIALPITRAISRIVASRLRKTTSDMLTIFDALVEEISAG